MRRPLVRGRVVDVQFKCGTPLESAASADEQQISNRVRVCFGPLRIARQLELDNPDCVSTSDEPSVASPIVRCTLLGRGGDVIR